MGLADEALLCRGGLLELETGVRREASAAAG